MTLQRENARPKSAPVRNFQMQKPTNVAILIVEEGRCSNKSAKRRRPSKIGDKEIQSHE